MKRTIVKRALMLVAVLVSTAVVARTANIYVTSSGNAPFDGNLQRAMQAFGHSVTIGVPYYEFNGTQSLAGVDVVYLQVNYNWDAPGMPDSGQRALVNFVNQGGGLVTCEWLYWRMADDKSFSILNPILPVDPTPAYDEQRGTTFKQDTADRELNSGLTTSLPMPLDLIAGTRTLMVSTRPGASSFYKTTDGFIALAGWNAGNGRVLSFATTNGQTQLADPSFQRLLSNALDWAEAGQTLLLAEGGVVNAASFAREQPVAPGSLVSIFGSGLAPSRATADAIPLSRSLGDISVAFNNIEAPLYFVSPQQINAQVPWALSNPGVTNGTVAVVVRRGPVASEALSVKVAPLSPAIFSVGWGVGTAIALNEDGSLSAPTESISGVRSQPARIGSTIQILGTGLGEVDPPGRDGQASTDAQRRTLATPTVLIGGVAAQVAFSGLSPQFPGVYQLNVVVPKVSPGDRLPVQIRIGDITSTDRVTIAVRE